MSRYGDMKKCTLTMSWMLFCVCLAPLLRALMEVELGYLPLSFLGGSDGIQQLLLDRVSTCREDPSSLSIRSHMSVQRGLADRLAVGSA